MVSILQYYKANIRRPCPTSILQGPWTHDLLQQRSPTPHQRLAPTGGLGLCHSSFIPRSISAHNLTSIIFLHACQLVFQTKAPLGHCGPSRHTHAKTHTHTHAKTHTHTNSFLLTHKSIHTCGAVQVTLPVLAGVVMHQTWISKSW